MAYRPPSEAIDSPRSEDRYSTRHDGREMLPGPARYGHHTDTADIVESREHESQNIDAAEHPFVPQVAAGGQTAKDRAETWHDQPAAEPVYDQPVIGDEPHHPRWRDEPHFMADAPHSPAPEVHAAPDDTASGQPQPSALIPRRAPRKTQMLPAYITAQACRTSSLPASSTCRQPAQRWNSHRWGTRAAVQWAICQIISTSCFGLIEWRLTAR
jgi:hypothetical protein